MMSYYINNSESLQTFNFDIDSCDGARDWENKHQSLLVENWQGLI